MVVFYFFYRVFYASLLLTRMAIEHTAFVYEMTVPYKGLYVYREVQRFQLPTNRNNVVLLCRSVPKFLLFKVCTFM
jgi:hypothetical protein